MPVKPKRPCSKPGCRNLTEGRYCEDHAHLAEMSRKERHKRYDEQQRDKKAAAFYRSVEWERAREQALIRDHGLCQDCLLDQRITTADMVHHKIPVRMNWDLRLRLDNLVSLCNRCHAKIDHSKLG